MIKTWSELKDYLSQDAKNYSLKVGILDSMRQYSLDPMHNQSTNWSLIKWFRYSEFFFNNRKKSFIHYLLYIIVVSIYRKISIRVN